MDRDSAVRLHIMRAQRYYRRDCDPKSKKAGTGDGTRTERGPLGIFGDKAISRELAIHNRLGMHARPAALFVQTACRFSADISVKKDKQVIDGKSILGLLMLAAGQGTRLTVSARGADAVEALNALEKLITSKFGED
jgi:phosphocarrier protein